MRDGLSEGRRQIALELRLRGTRGTGALREDERRSRALVKIEAIEGVGQRAIPRAQQGNIGDLLEGLQDAIEAIRRVADVAAPGVRRDDEERNARAEPKGIDLRGGHVVIESAEV